MKAVKIAEATASLGDYVLALQKAPLVVTSKGKPIAALVPIQGMDMETLAVGTSPAFLDIIERSRRREREEGGLTSEQMREQLHIKPLAARDSKMKNGKIKTQRRAKKA